MGVRILSQGDKACMYCSTTDWAFGPIFDSTDKCDAVDRVCLFLEFLGRVDPRSLSEAGLQAQYNIWQKQEQETEK